MFFDSARCRKRTSKLARKKRKNAKPLDMHIITASVVKWMPEPELRETSTDDLEALLLN
jgi:hypothetical protein